MAWGCIFGSHRPSSVSVARSASGLRALCNGCGLPLERSQEGRWTPALPLAAQPIRSRRKI
jgi:hypothetical protein